MTGPARARRPSRKASVTSILMGLFIASALVRLAGGTAVAIAREVEAIASPISEASPVTTPDDAAAEIDFILAELKQRRSSLDERSAELDRREADIRATALAVEAPLERLTAAEARLREVLSLANTAAADDVMQLTDVYQKMKPKHAAAVFEQMDPKFAAGFLARMNPDNAANIVAGLDPQTAYKISVILAGRHVGIAEE